MYANVSPVLDSYVVLETRQLPVFHYGSLRSVKGTQQSHKSTRQKAIKALGKVFAECHSSLAKDLLSEQLG